MAADLESKPPTPTVYHILMALADGEKHGYAIAKDVEVQTEGRFKIGPGTLYGAIKRLLASGHIEETDERPDPELDDERRRYYRLTGVGHSLLLAENQRLARALHVAQERQALSALGVGQ